MSCFVGFGDKSRGNLKNLFQTQGFEFLFLSQRAQRGHHGGSIALKTSRDFAEAHRTIYVYTRDKEIELEVFAVDVVDANSEGKRTDFADTAELDAYLGGKLSQTGNSRTVVFATYSADN